MDLSNFNENVLKLVISGQCVFLFENKNNDNNNIVFSFKNKEKTDGIRVEFTQKEILVTRIVSGEKFIDHNNNRGLCNSAGSYYWFSLDAQNERFYAGTGEARIETKNYHYSFTNKDIYVWNKNKSFLESLDYLCLEGNNIDPMRLLKYPITKKVPLKVGDTNILTMDDIAEGNYLPNANLPLVGQKLYNCVSGKRFVLDDNNFPDFSQAIEYNIITPGCWCFEKLREKSTEFNKDKPNLKETYLRITLGENDGDSPGIPYVLEIWPVGHYSPIHSHSNADAIIRVLHGSINVSLYPFLCSDTKGVEPFGNVNFNKDDITWITPTLNQIHKLKNLDTNKYTCITIQCYMYGDKDHVHYDYFDYRDDNGKIQPYEPDSDMDFVPFKKLMKEQWLNKK